MQTATKSVVAGKQPDGLLLLDTPHVALRCAALAIAWGGMIAKLATDWSTNSQYEFGFFVPLFVVYLLGRRWSDRPAPTATKPGNLPFITWILMLAALFPIRIVQEANPDWRPLNWIHATVIVLLTISMVASLGGKSWVAHFILPTVLIYFCLPWPLALEQGAIKHLTGAVTRVTVELLNLVNIPALQRGNVIELAVGAVGVAEACSGMRSLAGTLMASAFFGEYYRLFWPKRIALIVGGVVIAFCLNLCRTFFLGWRTAAEGTAAVDNWHDPAGYTIFLVSFAMLWLLAKAISADGHLTVQTRAALFRSTGFGAVALVLSIVWMLGVYGFSEGWYRFREGGRKHCVEWRIEWPSEGADFRFQAVPDEVRSILRYSEGASAVMNWPDGKSWNIYSLSWEPGRSSSQLATMHRPDICMPAAGYKMLSKAEPLTVPTKGIVLVFDGSVFQARNEPMYVYRCLWEEEAMSVGAQSKGFDMSISGRLLSAWCGRRNLGQKLIQIGITGASNELEAREHLAKRLGSFIRSDS